MTTITTAAELDTLPYDSVIRWAHRGGMVGLARKGEDPDTGRRVWEFAGGFTASAELAELIALMGSPAEVIYPRPDQQPTAQPTVEQVAFVAMAAANGWQHNSCREVWDNTPDSAEAKRHWLTVARAVLALFEAAR